MGPYRIVLLGPPEEITLQIGPQNVTFKKGEPQEVDEALQAELLARGPDQLWSDPDATSDERIVGGEEVGG